MTINVMLHKGRSMVQCKHLINKPGEEAVREALQGLAYANPNVELDYANKIVYRRTIPSDAVAIISGGGSGHEPSHAGMVGKGLLTAAVCGPPFASPNSGQITSALKRTIDTKGTLLVVKQYTGDCLSFGLAKERFAATHPEHADKVRMLVVGDDVAVGKEAGGLVGRRGLAGTNLVYKVAGAAAARGADLDEVYKMASYVAENSATIGAGLEHCHVPGADKAEDTLKADEVEIGMGIHNEPGNRTAQLSGSTKLVGDMMSHLTDTSDPDRSFVPFKNDSSDEVVLLVNNLGALPELELNVVLRDAAKWLAENRFIVVRAIAGQFMTSFAMPGVSITLVRLPRRGQDEVSRESVLDALDAPADAPGWRWSYKGEPSKEALTEPEKEERSDDSTSASEEKRGPGPESTKTFRNAVERACKSVIAAEPEITRYDQELGDGDCGQTLKSGAEAVLARMDEVPGIDFENLNATLLEISRIVEKDMGGTSGALYSIFFSALASEFGNQDPKEGKADSAGWAKALEHALNQLYRYTRARPPSRTLVDPLSSFISTLVYDPNDLETAFKNASEAAEATTWLDAKIGRAAYVGEDKVKSAEVPDAGAWGVHKLLVGVREAIVDGQREQEKSKE